MIRIGKFFRVRGERRQWEQPRSSIGDWRGHLPDQRYTCWTAVGPVRETWRTLGPEIKNYIEMSCEYGPALSVEIYMIGRDEDRASPKILICSTDRKARKMVRNAIMESGIMDRHPAIGLGDISRLPDLLAQKNIDPAFASKSNTVGNETVIDGLLRPATAGPLLYIQDKIYQLTVGHAFLDLDHFASPDAQTLGLDECDFDGQSDSEDDNHHDVLEIPDKGNLKVKSTLLDKYYSVTGNQMGTKLQDSSSRDLESPFAIQKPVVFSPDAESADSPSRNVSIDKSDSQTKQSVLIRRLDRIGKLALCSETGSNQSLDYAIIELEGPYQRGSNDVACGPNGNQRWLRIRQDWWEVNIGSEDANIITATSSSGFLGGRMCATPSYLRLPNQRTLQEVYSVRLRGTLSHGDCGSGVIGRHSGHLYGHIVAGNVSSGSAYIVPAKQVLRDVSDRLGKDVSLVPPEKLTHPGLEPLRVVELGSKQYFSQMGEASGLNKDKKIARHPIPTTPKSSAPFLLPSEQQAPRTRPEQTTNEIRGIARKKGSTGRRLLAPIGFRSKHPTGRPKSPLFQTRGEGKKKASYDTSQLEEPVPQEPKQQEVNDMIITSAMKQHFFTLPGEIQVQIIASLTIPDIMNLRLASRTWYNVISFNETPITRAFLEYNKFPPFATSLYPPPHPAEITLHYICGLWHRLSVASRLSTDMTNWATRDIFLCKTDSQRRQFLPQQARMRYRLIPLLFTIFHFFETYRHLCLEHLLENSHNSLHAAPMLNSMELKIMNMYDNEKLLQVHQIFPFLVSSFQRSLRPPSYLGRFERSLRGFTTAPPYDNVHAAIFSIGGLKQVARFSEIQGYEARRMAVNEWYNSLSGYGIIHESPHLDIPSRQSQLASINAADSDVDNKVSASGNDTHLPKPSDDRSCGPSSRRGEGVIFNTSLAAGPPMDTLPTEHAQLLMANLPSLQQIWVPTAEALILSKQVVARRQDIKKDGEVLWELIRESVTDADELFYGQAAHDIIEGDGSFE